MNRKIAGKRRKYSDEQVAAVRAWRPQKSLAQLCRELGVNPRNARFMREHHYKGPSP